MREYLLFRLYGPMSSWGDIAVGEYRPSFSYPSKSAICGLIAAALGIDRHEDEKHVSLSESIGFSLKVISSGKLLRDYHTIQTPGNTKRLLATRKDELADRLVTETILSTRDYRLDAVYDICISMKSTGQFNLVDIQRALKAPKFTLYLGRKSCVIAAPLNPEILSGNSVISVLNDYGMALTKLPEGINILASLPDYKDSASAIYLWEENSVESADHIQTRRDSVLSRRRWQFQERLEKYKLVQSANHNAKNNQST